MLPEQTLIPATGDPKPLTLLRLRTASKSLTAADRRQRLINPLESSQGTLHVSKANDTTEQPPALILQQQNPHR
ncbi:MAG: hypothetical protein ACK6D6_15125 [Planctomyces sp.]|jgi:hypothetical protein|nr:hypothetical protein [Planctomycetaceae bacterium]